MISIRTADDTYRTSTLTFTDVTDRLANPDGVLIFTAEIGGPSGYRSRRVAVPARLVLDVVEDER